MSGPIDRVRAEPGAQAAFDALASGLSGADLRSLLLHVANERADHRTPSQLLDQYRSDRFCAPAPIDAITIAQAEATALRSVSGSFRPVQLSPLAPLATSASMSAVPQNNVVTTMRLTDVVSDPTNVLALEAAIARQDDPSETARFAAAHRVVRAQRFDGPRSFAHFSLLGMVSAGRDRGDRAFEVEEIIRHVAVLAGAITAIDPQAEVTARVSDHTGRLEEAHAIVDQLDLDAAIDTARTHGRGYYDHLCVKVNVRRGDELIEVGDGGSVRWTQHLLSNRKERLVISGLGLDRIVM